MQSMCLHCVVSLARTKFRCPYGLTSNGELVGHAVTPGRDLGQKAFSEAGLVMLHCEWSREGAKGKLSFVESYQNYLVLLISCTGKQRPRINEFMFLGDEHRSRAHF